MFKVVICQRKWWQVSRRKGRWRGQREGDVRAAAWSLRLMTSWWLIDSLLSGTLLIATATSLYYLQVVLFLPLIKWPSPQFDRVPFHCCDCVLLCSSIFYLIFFWWKFCFVLLFMELTQIMMSLHTHTHKTYTSYYSFAFPHIQSAPFLWIKNGLTCINIQ